MQRPVGFMYRVQLRYRRSNMIFSLHLCPIIKLIWPKTQRFWKMSTVQTDNRLLLVKFDFYMFWVHLGFHRDEAVFVLLIDKENT